MMLFIVSKSLAFVLIFAFGPSCFWSFNIQPASSPVSATNHKAMQVETQDVTNMNHLTRRNFLAKSAVIFGASFLITPNDALADSTGKFSSKATARKRYLPRITAGIATFKTLKQPLAEGNWEPIENFLGEPADDLLTAMSLYASASKKGEYPDADSRARAKEVEDFGKIIKKIPSFKKGKNVKAASEKYDDACSILTSYLSNLQLPLLDSEEYN
mmetsp:Transcript_34417/g.44201  ORF Transcript_34417/g.44201 Transcript_34417/m.44201 type:complete len:215 (-) Transcript_34417:450-1094(-)